MKNKQDQPLSKCCNAPVHTAHGCDSDSGHGGKPCSCTGAVTMWYECDSCHEPCDVVSDPPQVKKNPLGSGKLEYTCLLNKEASHHDPCTCSIGSDHLPDVGKKLDQVKDCIQWCHCHWEGNHNSDRRCCKLTCKHCEPTREEEDRSGNI